MEGSDIVNEIEELKEILYHLVRYQSAAIHEREEHEVTDHLIGFPQCTKCFLVPFVRAF